jgi:UDP-glucose 4-epimerase
VTDVVEAFLQAATSDATNGQVFNLGHREHVSLKELAQLLVKLNGSGTFELIPFPDDRKAIDIGDYYADFRKVETAVGWSPAVSLKEGLARTIDYYRANAAHYW